MKMCLILSHLLMTRLTIPCHWNRAVLDRIVELNKLSSDIKVAEIYGVLARGAVPHGRAPSVVPDVTKEQAISFREKVPDSGLKFIYLLNAPLSLDLNKGIKEIGDYLNWVINEFGADALMVTSHDLMRLIRTIDKEIPIYISTIAGILNADQLDRRNKHQVQ